MYDKKVILSTNSIISDYGISSIPNNFAVCLVRFSAFITSFTVNPYFHKTFIEFIIS
jgi:hypothetical protein